MIVVAESSRLHYLILIGERDAIALAETARADLLLINDRAGAKKRAGDDFVSRAYSAFFAERLTTDSLMYVMSWPGLTRQTFTSMKLSSRASSEGGWRIDAQREVTPARVPERSAPLASPSTE